MKVDIELELDYSIKDAGFEILIEVGVKGLNDVYTLKNYNLTFLHLRYVLS